MMADINVPPKHFEINDEVYCLNFGNGKVTSNTGLYGMPIKVEFDNTKQEYTKNGAFVTNSKRCLFHADENVKVTVTEPNYKYQIIFKFKGSSRWGMTDDFYLSVSDFDDDGVELVELFLPSKRPK